MEQKKGEGEVKRRRQCFDKKKRTLVYRIKQREGGKLPTQFGWPGEPGLEQRVEHYMPVLGGSENEKRKTGF